MMQGIQSPCSVTPWRVGIGREVGRGVSGWRGYMYAYGQFILMYGKKQSQYCNYPPMKINKILKIYWDHTGET